MTSYLNRPWIEKETNENLASAIDCLESISSSNPSIIRDEALSLLMDQYDNPIQKIQRAQIIKVWFLLTLDYIFTSCQ
jgi:hypothetical protein